MAMIFTAAAWIRARKRSGTIFVYLAFTALACTLALTEKSAAVRQTATLTEQQREYLGIRGVVSYEPVTYDTDSRSRKRYYFPLDLKEFNRSNKWERADGEVRVKLDLPAGSNPPSYGDLWEFQGLLKVGRDADDANEWNAGLHLATDSGNAELLERNHGSPLIAFCLTMRRKAASILAQGLADFPRQTALLKALLLGYREGIGEATYNHFSTTGTIHILAISGLHVGLIAGILTIVLRCLGLSRTHWYLVLAPMLILYTVGTGMRPSAIRASMMAIIYWSAPAFKRKPDVFCSFALTVILILLFSPVQLTDVGFQFSFIIVGGIITILPFVNRYGWGVWSPDPWQLQAEPSFFILLRQGIQKTYFLITITLAAWLVSMPLVLYYGNLFSPIALIANLVVLPLTTVVVGIGSLSLLFGSLSNLLAEIFNHANRLFLDLLLNFVDTVSGIPGGHFHVESPPPWFLVLYYLSLAILFIARRTRLRWVAGTLLAFCAFCVFGLADAERGHIDSRQIESTVCSKIDFKYASDVLINCGYEFSSHRLKQWLRSEGVNRIPILILTQVDSRHAGALEPLTQSFDVDQIWIPDYESKSPLYSRIEKLEKRGEFMLKRISASNPRDLKNNVEIEFFNPRPDWDYWNTEAAALVFRLARLDKGLILVGSSRLPPGLFAQPKDILAPVWSLEGIPANHQIPQEILERNPTTIAVGGNIPAGLKEKSPPSLKIWSLKQDGRFRYDL